MIQFITDRTFLPPHFRSIADVFETISHNISTPSSNLPTYPGKPVDLDAIEKEVQSLTDAELAKRGDAWSPLFHGTNNRKELAKRILDFFDTGSPVYGEECRFGGCKDEQGRPDGLIGPTELRRTIDGITYTLFSAPSASSGTELHGKACP
jgi:hypothetical protein